MFVGTSWFHYNGINIFLWSLLAEIDVANERMAPVPVLSENARYAGNTALNFLYDAGDDPLL